MHPQTRIRRSQRSKKPTTTKLNKLNLISSTCRKSIKCRHLYVWKQWQILLHTIMLFALHVSGNAAAVAASITFHFCFGLCFFFFFCGLTDEVVCSFFDKSMSAKKANASRKMFRFFQNKLFRESDGLFGSAVPSYYFDSSGTLYSRLCVLQFIAFTTKFNQNVRSVCSFDEACRTHIGRGAESFVRAQI